MGQHLDNNKREIATTFLLYTMHTAGYKRRALASTNHFVREGEQIYNFIQFRQVQHIGKY